ncbi:flagellin [Sinorhizobium meliloti]|uniref:flagellin N-terminal helical domain-containing protein n=1 Tax=Rhizobium meliloti TaxID=382 RepID=UPI000403FCC6|nr:flagellin [Sinorhizobium meliloti]MCM5691567.1 flagellin [Sinorhizobium meliloti]MDE3811422.1 flagellin [Sinorhizobium meliloti]MDE3826298.1 flagellin [Sinorhizobium meliloti]RVG30043.1 flagellin [Sinorhizobium meliloti]RVG45429.1 flagellin [Sinorhizobium meliloti]
MTSILTNVAAMAALQTLRTIGSNMEETQAHVSSGLRVGSASDNAAYWSIATTMRSDNMALSAVQDALGLGAAKVDTAYSGMESAIEVVKEISKKLVAATEEGVDKAKIQEEIDQLQDQLSSIADAASFSGENWLKAEVGSTVSVVASFVRTDAGVSVKKVEHGLSNETVLFGTTAATGILDTLHDIEEDSVALNVNIGGTTKAYTVKTYTTDDVLATTGGVSFDANGSLAVTTADADVGFYKIDADTWVKAVKQDAATATAETGKNTDVQEVAVMDSAATPAAWVVDTTDVPADVLQASVSNLDITTATNDQLDSLIQMVDDALGLMTSAAADLGSISMRIDLQSEFVSKLTDSIDSGVGRLVDADMNEESTRLKALQTQQQLAIQALSIANSASENILTLFR